MFAGENRSPEQRANLADETERQAKGRVDHGFDIDTVTKSDVSMPVQLLSSITTEGLDRIVGMPELMPLGTDVQPLVRREYGLLVPDMAEHLRVTTDPEYFEEHAESVETRSSWNALFVPPEFLVRPEQPSRGETLKDILGS